VSFEKTVAAVSTTLIGSGLLIYGLHQRRKLLASQSWPQTTGTVTKADIAVERDTESTSYSVAVLYDYEVNGVRHTGKRIAFDRRTYARKKRAEAELGRYPPNSSVTVYFDPERPANAVLLRESPYSMLYIVLGICLLGLVVWIVAAG
jgi:hypothetical protein